MSRVGVEQGAVYTFTSPLGARAVIGPSTADPDWIGYLDSPPIGLERASVREAIDNIDEASGARFDPFYYGPLAFQMSGLVYPDTGASSSRIDKLLAATDCMDADGLLAWTSELGIALQVNYRAQQPTRITDRRPKKFSIAGVSEDPTIFSAVEHQTNILPDPLVPGGFASPLASPLVSAPAVGGQSTVNNAGRSKTWPRVLVFGPCQNPYITNATTGQTVYLTYALNAGEYLALDFDPKERTILFGGAANRYSAFDSARSSWWPLLPGDNTIRIGYSAFSAGAQFQVFHRDAWG